MWKEILLLTIVLFISENESSQTVHRVKKELQGSGMTGRRVITKMSPAAMKNFLAKMAKSKGGKMTITNMKMFPDLQNMLKKKMKLMGSGNMGNMKVIMGRRITYGSGMGRKPGPKPAEICKLDENIKDNSMLTAEQKADILRYHNQARATVKEPTAANMRQMVWNHQLANLAQQFANNCSDKHNKKRHTPPFTGVGENLFFSGGFSFVNGKKVPDRTLNVTLACDSWWNEKTHFDFAHPKKCPLFKCGHYTQMARDKSYAIGCGWKFCEGMNFFGRMADQNVLVCNYGEGYNRLDTPYEEGPPCSKCDDDFPDCVNGICVMKNP